MSPFQQLLEKRLVGQPPATGPRTDAAAAAAAADDGAGRDRHGDDGDKVGDTADEGEVLGEREATSPFQDLFDRRMQKGGSAATQAQPKGGGGGGWLGGWLG